MKAFVEYMTCVIISSKFDKNQFTSNSALPVGHKADSKTPISSKEISPVEDFLSFDIDLSNLVK